MWRVVLCSVAVMVVGVGLAFVFAPERDVVTSIEIAASPARVWAVLADTADYPAWNPDMRLVGRLQVGQVIEHDEGQGSDRMVFHPVVLAAEPGTALRWFARIGFWHVFDAEHYFLMAPGKGGTMFTQGERFRGVALWVYDVRQLVPGFVEMNTALKKRAEIKH